MKKITIEEAKANAERRGLDPVRLKGTDAIIFTKAPQSRCEVVSWEDVRALMEENGSELYDDNGWIKLV